MAEFKPIEIHQYPRVGQEITDDVLYWKRLGFPVACKEYGSIDYVHITEQEPFKIAVTCSSKVQIYSSVENKVQSTLSSFKKTAYGGIFRKDGKLLAAGSDDGYVRLFEVQTGKPLRIFKGHKGAVHRCGFSNTGTQVISFSDDKSVKLWDIPTETSLLTFEEHKDYVRSGAVSQASEHIFLSGSYDHTVKMYDSRTTESILTIDHGAPVESVLMFPTGGIFLTAGGTYLKVWDRVAGRILAQVTQHHKTITSLCFASSGHRLMSGSLDRHVKIYDVMTYKVVHTLDYSSPILSVASAPEDKFVAVGMVDGLLSIRHQRPAKKSEKEQEKKLQKKKTHFQNRYYGSDFRLTSGDIVVPELEQTKVTNYNRYLKKFESTKALDAVLGTSMQKKNPEITVSLMMELIRRNTIRAALSGREGRALLQLFKFVTKYISDRRFMRVLADIGLMLIEVYGPKINDPIIQVYFERLKAAVDREVQYMKDMLEVQGIIQGILAVAELSSISAEEKSSSDMSDIIEMKKNSSRTAVS